jgi:hypothetical protein
MRSKYKRPFESKLVEMFKTEDRLRHELIFQNFDKMYSIKERSADNTLQMGFSENILFCQRAKYHGFKIKATPKVKCKHIKFKNGEKIVLSV